jgi:hypothetical protein
MLEAKARPINSLRGNGQDEMRLPKIGSWRLEPKLLRSEGCCESGGLADISVNSIWQSKPACQRAM